MIPVSLAPWKKSYDKPKQCIKKQRHHFANKGPCSKSYGFLSSHVRMWELNQKEGWALKNWCFLIVVLEKTLDSKKIKPVNPKGNQSWIFIGRADAKADAPVHWPADAKSQLIGKDLDTVKDWRQEEKRVTEDEVIGWHHWLSEHEFEPMLGDREKEPWRATLQGSQRVAHD